MKLSKRLQCTIAASFCIIAAVIGIPYCQSTLM